MGVYDKGIFYSALKNAPNGTGKNKIFKASVVGLGSTQDVLQFLRGNREKNLFFGK